MISFALRRYFTPRGQAWRCIQPLVRPPNCLLMKAQEHYVTSTMAIQIASISQLSTVSRLACTNSLSVKPLMSCLTSRLCHTNQQSAPKGGDRVPAKESFNMRVLAQAPKPALYLGFGGLLPFLAAPLLMAATQAFYPEVAFAQVAYGASIVSFLGGARWGFAIPEGSPAQPDWKNLGNSVVPSLLAWLALLCRDDVTEGALVVLMGLGLSLHYDLTLLPGYPGWFKAMRTVLTLVATFSLVATLTLKKLCTEKRIKKLQN